MIEATDTGLIPESMFAELSPAKPIATYLADRREDLPALVDAAFTSSAAKPEDLPVFQSKLGDQDPLARYWAAQGCLILGKAAAPAAAALVSRLDDPHSAIRVAAGHSLHVIGRPEGKTALLAELDHAKSDEALQTAVNALTRINALDDIPETWVERTLKDKNAGEYLKRLAMRLAKERG
jgi:N-sulfoglucosamine sulfohydrolase